MKIIYTNKAMNDVDGSISKAITSYNKAKKDIQIACVAILVHIAKCGDYRKANVLIEGLVGLNQKAVVEFFTVFGGLTVSEGSKGFDGWSGAEAVKLQEGKDTMWFDLKVQKAWEGFDLKAAVIKLVANAAGAEKRVTKDSALASLVNIDPVLLENLKKLAA